MPLGPEARGPRPLEGISANFHPGQLTLIMGPSGSGKTTLLSLLGCILTPDRGQVTIMDAPVARLSEDSRTRIRRRHIGYVFQAFRLFRSLSALENVLTALEISGVRGKPARQAGMSALEAMGLSDKWRLKPGEMSGGQKQRVAIARALVNDPPIILADEPTASLDSHSGAQIAETLKLLAAEQGRLVVVVSHDPRWAHLSDRTLTLEDGRIISDSEVR
ncbi:MAG TPA: ABC transporter ATP-binding protein [Blastocatellia bacterium]